MQGFQSQIQDKRILWRLDAAQITHKLGRTFRDKCPFFEMCIRDRCFAFMFMGKYITKPFPAIVQTQMIFSPSASYSVNRGVE